VHVLLIHQAFASEDQAGGTRHYELSKYLVERGLHVSIIASPISYLTGTESRTRSRIDGIDVVPAWTYASSSSGFLPRLLNFFSFMFSSFIAGLRTKKVDVVWGTSPPIFQVVSAFIVAKVRRKPFLLEIRDLWPDFAIEVGVLKNPLLIKASRWLERFLYRHADHVVINSPGFRDHVVAGGVSPDRLTLVSNGVDIGDFDETAEDHVREGLDYGDRFVVTYTGAHGMANDLDTLLEAADLLRNEEGILFSLIGGGKERERLIGKAKDMGLTNVRFMEAQPKSKIPGLLRATDACIALLKPIPMFKTTYPNKVFDYMAASKPTILVIDGVIRDVIEQADGGTFVPPGDPAALAKAVIAYRDDPERCAKEGANARAYVDAHFSRVAQADELRAVLENLEH
jgi:glycosyltransferase involved in cell wall biosynthesis